jgi:hypothetical protein
MRRRIERASRQPPPAPRARAGAPAEAAAPSPTAAAPAPSAPVAPADASAGAPAPDGPSAVPATARAARRGRGRGEATAAGGRRAPAPEPVRPRLAPDLAPVNLAIRVRKPLDDHLADLIDDLRRGGVRTSKVELIEMLLWEQTSEDAAAVRARLGAFRAAAPRGASAPLD